MIVIGAGGHAKEILEILTRKNELDHLYFFDSINTNKDYLFDKFKILHILKEVLDIFAFDNRFSLGIGHPEHRHRLAHEFQKLGGMLTSIISPDSCIGSWNCTLEKGVNVMSGVFVSNDVHIAEGTLLNASCHIHHDSDVGRYSEIGPGAMILGKVRIGDFSSIGSGAIILPGITMGNHVKVGAGAVVLNDLPDNQIVAGVPAKSLA